MDDVRQVPYRGSGTRTGQAIQYALENIFQPANGMRPDAPQILVTITDGKSQVCIKSQKVLKIDINKCNQVIISL